MSFWSSRPHGLALVELLIEGRLQRRTVQREAWAYLLELGWARRTGRSTTLALDPVKRSLVERTLDQAWPSWREVCDQLHVHGLRPTPADLERLDRQARFDALDPDRLPERINRRTAAALVGRHAKARLGPFEQVVLEDVEVTDDGIARMRPSVGLTVERDGVEHDARRLATLLGELVLSDRALRSGTRLAGSSPRAILTVENLGAYQDARVADDLLVIFVPGWNTRMMRDVLAGLEDVPIVHFGDLDPNGVAILEHLRRWRAEVGWLVPEFWQAQIAARGLTKRWPTFNMPPDAPQWVRGLVEKGIWLEQEVIVTDPRFDRAVEEAINTIGGRRPLLRRNGDGSGPR